MDYSKLREAVRRITSRYRVEAIVLFGSRARGNHRPWSDYDLLVVADFEEKYLDRFLRIYELTDDLGLNIEPHPYTMNEALEMLRKGNPIIVDALSEGVVLYAGNRFEELLRLYRKLVEKGLRRTETSIILPS
ncbi:MAG: nucleotidyltransferase domain-containing protein [Desulfurococcaceae archaeon]